MERIEEESETFGHNCLIHVHLYNLERLNRHPAAHPAPSLNCCPACSQVYKLTLLADI